MKKEIYLDEAFAKSLSTEERKVIIDYVWLHDNYPHYFSKTKIKELNQDPRYRGTAQRVRELSNEIDEIFRNYDTQPPTPDTLKQFIHQFPRYFNKR